MPFISPAKAPGASETFSVGARVPHSYSLGPACPPAVPLVSSQTETAEPFSLCDGGREE